MEICGETADELAGDGMIIINGRDVALVPYSLTLASEPGRLIAEGSICGPEPLLRQVNRAKGVKLALEGGPTVSIRCEGGHRGTRRVKVLRAGGATFVRGVELCLAAGIDHALSSDPR